MRLMEIALDCIRRGWYVFPCWPKSKKPMTPQGFKDATLDEVQVREWWSKTPDANVAIATGPSKLCVVDVDHGITEQGLSDWLTRHGLTWTYAVRTGRRPEFGIQLYYSGEGLKSTGWRLEDSSGDIRCATGYVMAAGSIHPDSGEAYTRFNASPVAPVPDSMRSLTTKANDPSMAVTVDDDTADDWKTWLLEYMDRNKLEPRDYEKRVSNGYWLGIHCPWESQHGRVLYLCPEMGLISLSDRVRKIGIGDCLGDTLFLRSMNLGGLDLLDLPDEALEGSVLIVDTAIRFMHGDENSAKDMKAFSDVLFDIQRRQGPKGVVIILYHSPKTTKDVFELTLENCLRGSGELGAAVTDAHGTRMQNPEDRWNSENFISHVKCRDYEGVEDFAVSCDRATGVLVRTGEVGVKAVLSGKRPGQKADLDGKDEAARAFINARLKEQPDVTVNALIAGLADLGIERKQTWVKMARLAIRGAGSKHTE